MKVEPSYYFQRCKGAAKVCHSRESGQPRKMLSYQPFLPTSFTAALGAHSNRKSAKCSGFWTPPPCHCHSQAAFWYYHLLLSQSPSVRTSYVNVPVFPFSFIRLLFPFSALLPLPGRGPSLPLSPLSISAQITRAVYQSLSQQASLGERGSEGARGQQAWFVD